MRTKALLAVILTLLVLIPSAGAMTIDADVEFRLSSWSCFFDGESPDYIAMDDDNLTVETMTMYIETDATCNVTLTEVSLEDRLETAIRCVINCSGEFTTTVTGLLTERDYLMTLDGSDYTLTTGETGGLWFSVEGTGPHTVVIVLIVDPMNDLPTSPSTQLLFLVGIAIIPIAYVLRTRERWGLQ